MAGKTKGTLGLMAAILLMALLALGIGWRAAVGAHAAPCSVSGFISTDTTWSPATCDPYIVSGSIIVQSGATLTIQAGTTVKFDSLKGLMVQGTLVARGTEASPITFTSNQATPTRGHWGSIQFADSSSDATFDGSGNYLGGSIIQYAVIEYGGAAGASGALSIKDSSPYIDHNTIRNNGKSGIYASSNSALRVTYNTITGNTGGGGIYAVGTATITGNTITGNTGGLGGGGIYGIYTGGISAVGTATITGNAITGNTGGLGGIYASGTVTITSNTITGNTANYDGGGIYAVGTATITGNTITGNTGRTGGIYAGGTATIIGNTITDNTGGGGIYANGTATITRNTITDNTGGGGIRVDGGSATVTSNTITGNAGGLGGGGIRVGGGSATITGNTITNNTGGGGITVDGGSATITGNTITNNTATAANRGGGIYLGATATINDNDLYGNLAGSPPTANDLSNGNPAGGAQVNAENNYWGTADPSVIEDHIWHFFDDSSLGLVDYTPFRTSPIPVLRRTFLPALLKESSGW